MALTRTAADLEQDVRNRADHVVGSFRSSARIRRYLSESARSLVSSLVDEFDELYWAKASTVSTTAGQETDDLPADAWKLIFMRVTIGGQRKRLRKAQIDDIDNEGVSAGGWTQRWPAYRIMGRQIYWAPIPRAVHEVRLVYVPTTIFFDGSGTAITELSADTDYFDGVFGWEELVALDAAMKLLADERKTSAELQQEWADRWATVAAAAAHQDVTEPARVRDTWRGGSDDDDRYREIYE